MTSRTLGSILEQIRIVNTALNRPALDLENNEDLTTLGLLLWRINELTTGLLDSIKEILRKRAVAVRGGLPGSLSVLRMGYARLRFREPRSRSART